MHELGIDRRLDPVIRDRARVMARVRVSLDPVIRVSLDPVNAIGGPNPSPSPSPSPSPYPNPDPNPNQVIAIGGGVCMDIVGFAASIYRRRTPYIEP